VLEDIKEYERRPEGTTGEWAEPIRRWYRISGHCPALMAAMSPEEREARERMSEDELAVRSGAWRERLIKLAITGRITKEEFESLVNRLQGN
jgi:hypothetical protein